MVTLWGLVLLLICAFRLFCTLLIEVSISAYAFNPSNLVLSDADITVDSDNDSVNISLDKTSIVDGTLSGTTININSATASKAGILVPTDKSKIDKIITNGNGTKYLSDNGTYKEVQGGSADIESLK